MTLSNQQAVLEELLFQTSRTFALTIPLLASPLREEITLAYLLFRIADTFEDAESWEPTKRKEALLRFAELLKEEAHRTEQGSQRHWEEEVLRWKADPPTAHEGYLRLLSEIPLVMQALAETRSEAKAILIKYTLRTTEGMISILEKMSPSGELRLPSIQALRDYCYIVAGIVGEMLSELFTLETPLLASLPPLSFLAWQAQARLFGEALQLVNILKDATDDATQGRSYLPPHVSRNDIFLLAQEAIQAAKEYIELLREAQASHAILAFTSLPLSLAEETLSALKQHGSGAKIGRQRVIEIYQKILKEYGV